MFRWIASVSLLELGYLKPPKAGLPDGPENRDGARESQCLTFFADLGWCKCWGWFKAEAARASRRKRSKTRGSFAKSSANFDESTLNIVTGESGIFLSPYYLDQWQAWYGGSTFPFPFSTQAVQHAKKHEMKLVPE